DAHRVVRAARRDDIIPIDLLRECPVAVHEDRLRLCFTDEVATLHERQVWPVIDEGEQHIRAGVYSSEDIEERSGDGELRLYGCHVTQSFSSTCRANAGSRSSFLPPPAQ